jgi:hypothetical protein
MTVFDTDADGGKNAKLKNKISECEEIATMTKRRLEEQKKQKELNKL